MWPEPPYRAGRVLASARGRRLGFPSAGGGAALSLTAALMLLGLPPWPLALLCAAACGTLFRVGLARGRRTPPGPDTLTPAQLQAALPRSTKACYLGKGGPWEAHHSLALHQTASPERGLLRSPARLPHAHEQWIDGALLARNILAVGAPGSGKSSLLVLLAWQAQLRGEGVLVLDPKGARSLQALLVAGAATAGRPCLALSLASDHCQLRYDPFRHCEGAGDIATRVCSLIGGERDDPFRDFCWGVVCTIVEVLLVRGRRPCLRDLRALLPDAGAGLLADPAGPPRHSTTPREHAAEQALRALVAHDRTHYRKMTVALLPVLELLCTGPLGRILEGASPRQDLDVTAALPGTAAPLLDLEHCRTQGTSLYIGLDALGHPNAAQALAQLLLEDLASEAARRLASRAACAPLHLMVDEAGEVACAPLLQLLGKGREAGVQILLAVQTLADLEWRLEGRAAAQVAYGNAGSWFLFRQLDAFSRRESAARLGELAVAKPSSSRGHSESMHSGHRLSAQSVGQGHTREFLPRIPEACFALLRDLECVAQLPDGQLRHVRLPVPLAA